MSSSGQMETEIVFSPEEPFFAGHFPERPVTPGVMLIDRAVAGAEGMLERKIVLRSIRKVKFSSPVLPGETVKLNLHSRGEKEIAYVFSRDGTLCASGILVF